MNTGTWTLVAWLCILGFVPVGTWLGWHYGRIEGRHEGLCAEKERELARRYRAELRVPYEGPEIRAKTGCLPTGKSNYTPGNFRTPGDAMVPGENPGQAPQEPMKQRHPDHITADRIARVIVPAPGTFPPQPGGTGPHTTRMPALTDTGELRALTAQTDAWLEGMRQKGLIA